MSCWNHHKAAFLEVSAFTAFACKQRLDCTYVYAYHTIIFAWYKIITNNTNKLGENNIGDKIYIFALKLIIITIIPYVGNGRK